MLIVKRPRLPAEANLFVHNWAEYVHLEEEVRIKKIAKLQQVTEAQIQEWLEDKTVQLAIFYETSTDEHEHGVDIGNVLRQVSRMTYYDPAQLVDGIGNPVPLHRLPEEIRAAIQGVEIQERFDKDEGKTVTYKYKLCDRNSSVDKLMRYMGLFERDNKQNANAFSEMLAQIYREGSRLPLHRAEIIEAVVEPAEEVFEPISVTDSPAEAELIRFQNPYK